MPSEAVCNASHMLALPQDPCLSLQSGISNGEWQWGSPQWSWSRGGCMTPVSVKPFKILCCQEPEQCTGLDHSGAKPALSQGFLCIPAACSQEKRLAPEPAS